jgi:hypothetical protein
MRNPFVFHIITAYEYIGFIKQSIEFNYNLKLSIEFMYKYLYLYSIVFMSARKKFRILEVFGFRNFG